MGQLSTVFIVDDDIAVRLSISTLLSSHGLSTECYPNAEAYLQHVSADRPGCLVTDLRMPGISGLQLLKRCRADATARPTVVITGYATVENAVEAMKLGSIDFLQKPCPPDRIVQAVKAALERDGNGRSEQDQRIAARRKIDALTDEERQVLAGIIRGQTNPQIAEELDVSLRTVQHRRSLLLKSLGVMSKPELLTLVQTAGWSPSPP